MHVALIIDEERLRQEHVAQCRLAVGLMGEGVQLTRIIPDSERSQEIERGERRLALATRLEAPMRVLPWLRRERTDRLAAALERQTPDVLYALGRDAWRLGSDLANRLERPLVVDVAWPAHVRDLPSGRNASVIAACITPSMPMAVAARDVIDPDLVCVVPMGVNVPSAPRDVTTEPDQDRALAILGGARDVPAYRAVLAGLSRVVRDHPGVRVFMELEGPADHEIWRDVRRLDLLEIVSVLGAASQVRSLLIQCDLIVLPERYGELRSALLEAMALELPIVASADPYLDVIIDEETALVVPEPEPDAWAQRLGRLLSEPDTARDLGRRARLQIAATHRSSDQVTALISCMEQVVSGGHYAFPTGD